MIDYPARERWRRLPRTAPRDEYFRVLHEAVAEFYLADPGNPYQQSGRSSGAARWEETRRIFVEAVHRSGDFIDIGCANGLLLETLIAWARGAGCSLRPHGIDLSRHAVELTNALGSGWRREGPPQPPRRRLTRDHVFGAEDGWGNPATGPGMRQLNFTG